MFFAVLNESCAMYVKLFISITRPEVQSPHSPASASAPESAYDHTISNLLQWQLKLLEEFILVLSRSVIYIYANMSLICVFHTNCFVYSFPWFRQVQLGSAEQSILAIEVFRTFSNHQRSGEGRPNARPEASKGGDRRNYMSPSRYGVQVLV